MIELTEVEAAELLVLASKVACCSEQMAEAVEIIRLDEPAVDAAMWRQGEAIGNVYVRLRELLATAVA